MPTFSSKRVIHIWSPAFTNIEGGIQEFSRFLTQGLRECFPSCCIEVMEYSVLSTQETFFPWFFRKLQSFFFSLRLVFRMILDRPKVIISSHIHFAPVAFLAEKWFGIPCILVLHGVEAWDPYPPRKARLLQQLTRYLAVSRFTRKRFIEASGVDPSKIGILPNTFDEALFIPAPKDQILCEKYGIGPGKRILLTVARLANTEKYKGYDQVLSLFPKLIEEIPSLHYMIVGRGTDVVRIQQMIRKLGIQNAVTLTGFVPRNLLPVLYNACDIYVMPSEGEGFGIAFLEALGCGKPCIGGSTDGSRDPLMDGKLGILVDPHNLVELEKAILTTLEGKETLGKGTTEMERNKMLRDEFGYDRFKSRIAMEISSLLNPS